MDQGIIQCFKAHYCIAFIQCSVDQYDSTTTPSEVYNIDQLEAMHLAQHAWLEVDTSTIQYCWQRAGILPEMTNTPLTQLTVPISLLDIMISDLAIFNFHFYFTKCLMRCHLHG